MCDALRAVTSGSVDDWDSSGSEDSAGHDKDGVRVRAKLSMIIIGRRDRYGAFTNWYFFKNMYSSVTRREMTGMRSNAEKALQ